MSSATSSTTIGGWDINPYGATTLNFFASATAPNPATTYVRTRHAGPLFPEVKVMDPLARQAFANWPRAQPAVSAFVHALVADRADRDDVLQDVAVAVLEAYGSYDPSRPFLPWALGIQPNSASK